MGNNFAKPEGYDKPWPISYGAPQKKELNAMGSAVDKSPWPTNTSLASKVSGTKADVVGQQGGNHPPLGVSQKNERIVSKVSSDSVKESSTGMIF